MDPQGSPRKIHTRELIANLRSRMAAPTAAASSRRSTRTSSIGGTGQDQVSRISSSDRVNITAAIRRNAPFLLTGCVVNGWGLVCGCNEAPRSEGSPLPTRNRATLPSEEATAATEATAGAFGQTVEAAHNAGVGSALSVVSANLARHFGATLGVPVVHCAASSTYDRDGAASRPHEEPLGAFLADLVQSSGLQSSPGHRADGAHPKVDGQVFATSGCGWNVEVAAAAVSDASDAVPKRYLKDFHFAKAADAAVLGGAAALYVVPQAFRDDWLNWWHDQGGDPDDYRFLYAGPRGSWTPMHHDVLRSFSWSVNLCGAKRWVLFRPNLTRFLLQATETRSVETTISGGGGSGGSSGGVIIDDGIMDADGADEAGGGGGGVLVADVRRWLPPVAARAHTAATTASRSLSLQPPPRLPPLPLCPCPRLRRALEECVVLTQGVGEALFVPSGWHHQVENLEATISVNHNWFNGFCLRSITSFILRELREVRTALGDLREGFVGDDHENDEHADNENDDDENDDGNHGRRENSNKPWERRCEMVMRANGTMGASEYFALLSRRVDHYETARNDAAAAHAAVQAAAACNAVSAQITAQAAAAQALPTSASQPDSSTFSSFAAIGSALACGVELWPRGSAADVAAWADSATAALWEAAATDERNYCHEARVAVHALIEIAVALKALAASEDASDHLFQWRPPPPLNRQDSRQQSSPASWRSVAWGGSTNGRMDVAAVLAAAAHRALECASKSWSVLTAISGPQ